MCSYCGVHQFCSKGVHAMKPGALVLHENILIESDRYVYRPHERVVEIVDCALNAGMSVHVVGDESIGLCLTANVYFHRDIGDMYAQMLDLRHVIPSCRPEEIWYVDNNWINLRGAREAGVQTFGILAGLVSAQSIFRALSGETSCGAFTNPGQAFSTLDDFFVHLREVIA